MPSPSPVRLHKLATVSTRDAKLRKHADYQRVYREGKRQSLPLMTYFFAARKQENEVGVANLSDGTKDNTREMPFGSRVGLTAGRVLGNAVERNRIKRRMRQAIRGCQSELTASVDVVLHPRRMVLEAEFSHIERDVLRAFRAVQLALKKTCDADSTHDRV